MDFTTAHCHTEPVYKPYLRYKYIFDIRYEPTPVWSSVTSKKNVVFLLKGSNSDLNVL